MSSRKILERVIGRTYPWKRVGYANSGKNTDRAPYFPGLRGP